MAFLTKYILVNNLMPLLENYKVIDEIIQYKNTKFEHFLVRVNQETRSVS